MHGLSLRRILADPRFLALTLFAAAAGTMVVLGPASARADVTTAGQDTYDPTSHLVYLTTKVNDADADHPTWYLHALDIATGAEKAGWPVPIVGTPGNDPSHPFRAKDVNQRAGLLLMNGVVYMSFGSQCD